MLHFFQALFQDSDVQLDLAQLLFGLVTFPLCLLE